MPDFDTIIIGGGQSALASAYYLRRANINFVILDNQQEAGGAWLHAWDSLTLFSPADHSSLPGYMMPATREPLATKAQVIDYLRSYEGRYQFNIQRPVAVSSVVKSDFGFEVITTQGSFTARTIISATGRWQVPIIPRIPGAEEFRGNQIHSAFYKNAEGYKGKKVLIVGAGNSGAQILAEISEVAHTKWATQGEPAFLPDDVDGRVLFDAATAKYHSMKNGKEFNPSKYNLGNIVMVPSVKRARDRGVFKSSGTINRLNQDGIVWDNGISESFDEIIWCTGFGYATQHLSGLVDLDNTGKTQTTNTKSAQVDGLWLVGYGSWTGFASATLIGVGRSAKQTALEIENYLSAWY